MSKKHYETSEDKKPYFPSFLQFTADLRNLVFSTSSGFLFAEFGSLPLEPIVNFEHPYIVWQVPHTNCTV